MDVCKSCHERDKNVTQCKTDVKYHLDIANWRNCRSTGVENKCEVCGKTIEPLYYCSCY